MKKIPTLFVRSLEDRSRITSEITPGLEWVLNPPKGTRVVATVKWDGTSCWVSPEGDLWRRRIVRPGQEFPPYFRERDFDPATEKRFGWVPVSDHAPEDEWHREAWARTWVTPGCTGLERDCTYELIGPKVSGNPHNRAEHQLIKHGRQWVGFGRKFSTEPGWTFDLLKRWLEGTPAEGLVFWRYKGRKIDAVSADRPVAKVKSKDFGLDWPRKAEKLCE